MALYSTLKEKDGKYYVTLDEKEVEFKDDLPYLEYFANGNSIIEFMANEGVWGEDLTKYDGFCDTFIANVGKIKQGKYLI